MSKKYYLGTVVHSYHINPDNCAELESLTYTISSLARLEVFMYRERERAYLEVYPGCFVFSCKATSRGWMVFL